MDGDGIIVETHKNEGEGLKELRKWKKKMEDEVQSMLEKEN